jgi:hypothetical protein
MVYFLKGMWHSYGSIVPVGIALEVGRCSLQFEVRSVFINS